MKYDKAKMTIDNIPLKETENKLLILFTTAKNLSVEEVNRALSTYEKSNSAKVLIHKFNKNWDGLLEIRHSNSKGYNLVSFKPITIIEKYDLEMTLQDKRLLKYKNTLKDYIRNELNEYIMQEQQARTKLIENIREVLK